MVQFRPQAKEIIAKIVYYGPPLGGKTTNLRTLYKGYPPEIRGELVVVPAGGDRTIFFDFLPLDAGTLRNMKLRVQLYTVPGQVHYNATRQIVLRGVDAVVFVADSQHELGRSNRDSFEDLKNNLLLQGLQLAELPHVLQFNKRDIKGVMGVEELNTMLNEFNVPFFEAVATVGIGVEETLQGVVKLVARSLRDRFKLSLDSAGELADVAASLSSLPGGRDVVSPPRSEGRVVRFTAPFEPEAPAPQGEPHQARPAPPAQLLAPVKPPPGAQPREEPPFDVLEERLGVTHRIKIGETAEEPLGVGTPAPPPPVDELPLTPESRPFLAADEPAGAAAGVDAFVTVDQPVAPPVFEIAELVASDAGQPFEAPRHEAVSGRVEPELFFETPEDVPPAVEEAESGPAAFLEPSPVVTAADSAGSAGAESAAFAPGPGATAEDAELSPFLEAPAVPELAVAEGPEAAVEASVEELGEAFSEEPVSLPVAEAFAEPFGPEEPGPEVGGDDVFGFVAAATGEPLEMAPEISPPQAPEEAFEEPPVAADEAPAFTDGVETASPERERGGEVQQEMGDTGWQVSAPPGEEPGPESLGDVEAGPASDSEAIEKAALAEAELSGVAFEEVPVQPAAELVPAPCDEAEPVAAFETAAVGVEQLPPPETVGEPWEAPGAAAEGATPGAAEVEAEAAPAQDQAAGTPVEEVVVEPDSVPAVESMALQRAVGRAITTVGDVRELEVEVPVPAVWTGGKRMTLQLRLTLVPQEEKDGS